MIKHREWPVRPAAAMAALLVGGLLAASAALLGDPWCGPGWLWAKWRWAYDAVGIVILGLIPLAVWGGRLIAVQFFRCQTTVRMELDYGYIARTATLLGLLGTIISLSVATVRLGHEVVTGSSAAILKVIPLTGQALMSTFVGLIISLAAETALHLIERKQQPQPD